jgi:hypothetical protein
MKKLVLFAVLALASVYTKAQAPTVTLPSAQSSVVTLNWTNNCTAAQPCTITPFRIVGQCPATLTSSTGWTQLANTAAQAISAQDTTVASGITYSYVVEAQFVGGTTFSGPSNCVTLTVPNAPSVPTNLTGK